MNGQEVYGTQCSACHGGGINKGLTPAMNIDPENLVHTTPAALAAYIDANMPKGNANACDAQCAADTAAYILTWEPAIVADAVAGQATYSVQCAACHGDGINKGLLPSMNIDPDNLVHTTQANLAAYIDANMPKGNPTACDAQCSANTAAYILTWEPAAPAGNKANGQALYGTKTCAVCHGANRQGGNGPALTTAALTAKYDTAAEVQAKVKGMALFGAPTTDAEALDITAFLLGD